MTVWDDGPRIGESGHVKVDLLATKRSTTRTMKNPVKGTFDACDTVVEIDWHRGDEEDTTLGVIVGHVTGDCRQAASVVVDRVFNDDDPEHEVIAYEDIDEIRTGPEQDDRADPLEGVNRIVWTVASQVPAKQVKVVLSYRWPLTGDVPVSDAELELGPFTQGVALEQAGEKNQLPLLRDVASREVIAQLAPHLVGAIPVPGQAEHRQLLWTIYRWEGEACFIDGRFRDCFIQPC